MSRTSAEPPVVIERAATVSLTDQITWQLREAIRRGQVGAGERLPSTRALAVTLAVSRTVVSNAYAQLYAEGWLEGRHGSGSYAAPGAGTEQDGDGHRTPPSAGPGTSAARGRPASVAFSAAAARSAAGTVAGPARSAARTAVGPAHSAARTAAGLARSAARSAAGPASDRGFTDLRPGIPWAAGISETAWRRAWRRAGTVLPSAATDPAGPYASSALDPRGSEPLPEVLSGYLRRMRGVSFQPDEIVITRGVANSVDMLFAALLRPGDRVGIEEPGYPVAREIALARGLEPVPCPVDEQGLVVDRLPERLRLVYTTPAHQYPVGGRLPVPRRRALLTWASRTGAYVVEDDYDSEFRYDVAPLPALYGLGPHGPATVVYLGTTAKTLTPELNVGWLVAREDVVGAVLRARQRLGDKTPTPAQQAVAELIARGELERHIRRMRLEYARRRAAIVAALADLPPPARLLGDTAGMHVLLELPDAVVAPAIEAAAGHGIALMALDRRYFGGPVTAHGLVLGYGGASLSRVISAGRTLREVLLPLLRRAPV